MELKDIAKNVLVSCLAAKAGEEVLIITDDTRVKIGQALYDGAKELGCEAMLMVMQERELSGQEPPKAVAAAMKTADIVIAPTAKSLTHTNARIQAAANGARVGTMPGITEQMFSEGAMTADYDEVAKLTAKVTEMLTKAKVARVEKDGCVLTINLDGRNGVPSPGIYREKGQSGNMPSGEAYIAPLEDGADGEMIIDGSMVGIGKLESPLRMKIRNGKLYEITGEKSEMELRGSNVLRFELSDGTVILVRPSGTEPKVKVYVLTQGKDAAQRDENIAKYAQWVKTLG